MVNREDCVVAINKFIQSQKIEDLVVLLNYLCEIKNVPNREDTINKIVSVPLVLSVVAPTILEQLENLMKINRITNQNNILISVF